eukprot:15434198-Alexandrium_andersonii.AAC.1
MHDEAQDAHDIGVLEIEVGHCALDGGLRGALGGAVAERPGLLFDKPLQSLHMLISGVLRLSGQVADVPQALSQLRCVY